jgi:hypothetical protein
MYFCDTARRAEEIRHTGIADEPHFPIQAGTPAPESGKGRAVGTPYPSEPPPLWCQHVERGLLWVPQVRLAAEVPSKTGQPIRIARSCSVCPPVPAVHDEARFGDGACVPDACGSLYGCRFPSQGKGKL